MSIAELSLAVYFGAGGVTGHLQYVGMFDTLVLRFTRSYGQTSVLSHTRGVDPPSVRYFQASTNIPRPLRLLSNPRYDVDMETRISNLPHLRTRYTTVKIHASMALYHVAMPLLQLAATLWD